MGKKIKRRKYKNSNCYFHFFDERIGKVILFKEMEIAFYDISELEIAITDIIRYSEIKHFDYNFDFSSGSECELEIILSLDRDWISNRELKFDTYEGGDELDNCEYDDIDGLSGFVFRIESISDIHLGWLLQKFEGDILQNEEKLDVILRAVKLYVYQEFPYEETIIDDLD